MIKCVLFDLDGVLADATEWHYRAFNQALMEVGLRPIPYDEHLKYYNGLPTATKLEIMSSKGFDITPELFNNIKRLKQKATIDCIDKHCAPDNEKLELISTLRQMGCKLGVCTNAVRETLDFILDKSELTGFDITLSNEDVSDPKPSPEIYLKAMDKLGISPEETLIVEDSPKGEKSAIASGAHVLKVDGFHEVTCENVLQKLAKISYHNLQILIPMAGRGSRFARVGYTLPKPLIPILGKPMIKHVIDNLVIDNAKLFLVALQEHVDTYPDITQLPGTVVVQTGYRQGAACSAQLAFEHLDHDAPLMVANSDQFLDINILDFLVAGVGCDGAIMTFKSEHPKWSYASLGLDDYVDQVKEKVVISDNATSGIYLWNRAGDFIDGINDMISADDTHNDEFYIAPSYNYCIKRGKKYRLMEIKRQQMWGLGTPEDLIKFVDHYEK